RKGIPSFLRPVTPMKYNYVIAGQGLAGSVLALTLLERGQRVLVCDPDAAAGGASWAAAGLYNPITGRHWQLTWRAADLFPTLERFYRRWERVFGVRFLHDRPIYRPFLDVAEQNRELARTAEPARRPFLDEVPEAAPFRRWVRDPYGGLTTRRSGYLDVPHFLRSVKRYLIEKEAFRAEAVPHGQLRITAEGVEGPGWSTAKLVCCEGAAMRENPYFGWLPLVPTKGEILVVEQDDAPWPNVIFNRGVFVLPVGERRARVGATFNRHDLSPEPTPAGRAELLDKLGVLLAVPVRVVDHTAGIRPTVRDRRPLIGQHPVHPALAVFNGLGTKGVSLAPYFAGQLGDFFEGRDMLDPAVNIDRYLSFYH
ncbi:MAG: FAD-binding oxidoreductase, partial [Catalinimonas sp.]